MYKKDEQKRMRYPFKIITYCLSVFLHAKFGNYHACWNGLISFVKVAWFYNDDVGNVYSN